MTGNEGIELIATATALENNTVLRFARAMREADVQLWPIGGRGGGKAAASVSFNHLLNLLIAVAVADPATDAPRIAPAFCIMERLGGEYSEHAKIDVPSTFSQTWGLNLAETVQWLLETKSDEWEYFTLDIGFSPNGIPYSEIWLVKDENNTTRLGLFFPSRIEAQQAKATFLARPGLTRTVHIGSFVWDALRPLVRA